MTLVSQGERHVPSTHKELDSDQTVYELAVVSSSFMSQKSRHRRMQRRVTLLVILGLLWSQLVLAGHGGCFPGDAITSTTAVAKSQVEHCGETTPSLDESLCEFHCSRADLQSDSTPNLSVPPLTLAWRIEWLLAVTVDVKDEDSDDVPQTSSWHRPTDHPASLLLI